MPGLTSLPMLEAQDVCCLPQPHSVLTSNFFYDSPNDWIHASLELHYQFMKVPFENLTKYVRDSERLIAIENFIYNAAEGSRKNMSKQDALQHLDSLLSQMQGFKVKADASNKLEKDGLQKIRKRLDHLQVLHSGGEETQLKWKQIHLDCILVEYMIRLDYYNTAVKLAEQSGIQDLVDINIFLGAIRVIQGLKNRDCSKALAWCTEHELYLKRSQGRRRKKKLHVTEFQQPYIRFHETQSNLEFTLRAQEFIELVRQDHRIDALDYLQKYLSSWAVKYKADLQQVMLILAFKNFSDSNDCMMLLALKRWDDLVDQFTLEFIKIYGITVKPLLIYYLQAGLSGLKTSACMEKNCPIEDPFYQDDIRKLAYPLPFNG
ncbi:hypothetical protein KP509_22G044200 [Ceratopteris richardii]|uniref:CTLH domain-containing protein n=1 Tax=Ceratopteris richardii TaxID=49495 RepID=A0A8T2S6G9_CERRI|nr:hypothetical protein KP509_22G044200 [Ceratopteris richardii]KAH7307057.1 hypothetical protein KP509_22G044200 [Ceratopteris richardii]KAH7307061.1 hypothetical protein KP509_22G044200 [Ceratopteris richardii]KAH7307067.1 hypothetical protein KP509_22G044200 [Ceratopteris richardii]KAH7307073.1 hypothetical protein KP509_22G044200 [Ceratopteris richardii]